ncbi:MAG: PepSY domain-containing protein [bacterium]
MSKIRNRTKVAGWHRWLGMSLSVPLLFWIVSAFFLHYLGLTSPNGLQGVYKLAPYNSVDVDLRKAQISPTAILQKLRSDHQIDEIYWLKLRSRGPHLWYVVKPKPFSTGMIFDANTGERLDPLSDELLRVVANESLNGSKALSLSPVKEYHRDYAVKTLPAVEVTMEGEQPTKLILSRDAGRTLRRSDSQARQFNWWYKTFHVFQWSESMTFFTTILYVLAAGVVILASFGLRLWWWRRARPKEAYRKPNMKARLWHRRLGVGVGILVIAQVLLGAYMWLSLGPLQDPFRGKNTFNLEWTDGIEISEFLPDAETVLNKVGPGMDDGIHQAQSIQWRWLKGKLVLVVNTRNDQLGTVYDAQTGRELSELTPQEAGREAQQLIRGLPEFEYKGETTYYQNDLNRKLPAYHLRFADASATDVFVSKTTGDIISRRTRFWRAFSPFLMLHTYAFSGNVIVDTSLLTIFQLALLLLIITGWRLNFVKGG